MQAEERNVLEAGKAPPPSISRSLRLPAETLVPFKANLSAALIENIQTDSRRKVKLHEQDDGNGQIASAESHSGLCFSQTDEFQRSALCLTNSRREVLRSLQKGWNQVSSRICSFYQPAIDHCVQKCTQHPSLWGLGSWSHCSDGGSSGSLRLWQSWSKHSTVTPAEDLQKLDTENHSSQRHSWLPFTPLPQNTPPFIPPPSAPAPVCLDLNLGSDVQPTVLLSVQLSRARKVQKNLKQKRKELFVPPPPTWWPPLCAVAVQVSVQPEQNLLWCYMIMRGSGTDSLMDLWGRTLAPFR